MTTDPLLRFVYGTRVLDLNDSVRFALEPDFTPPPANLSAQMSDGTSANRTGGATKIGQRAQNRSWSFTVQVLGGSERDVTRAFQDLAVFTGYAGNDKSAPLYLEYKPNSDISTKPLWGQDGWLRYEVRHAVPPTIGDRYGSTGFRARNVTALITCEVAPYAEGIQQRLCSAMGGVLEDTIGTVDGSSRGLIVPEATCNLFINPVFGNSTWSTCWTAGASMLSASSIDSRYLLPATAVSAKLTPSASTSNTFLQDVTLSASQHAIWSVIKLPDSGTPASTIMQMAYNGSTLPTSFTSAGNGFWYAAASAIGTGGAASAGVVVKKGQTIYAAALQAEKKTYRTALCWGSLLGCSWSASAHASTSTRTAGVCKVPIGTDTIGMNQGSARFVVRFDVSSSIYTETMELLDLRDGSSLNALRIFWSGGTKSFFLSENAGSTTANSDALTFSEGALYVIHGVWGASGLTLYVNGSLNANASNAEHIAYPTGANAFIGSNYSSANQVAGALLGVTFWDVPLTAAQVLADYNNLAAVVSDGLRVESIPWLWTKDGDNVVDNSDDSTHDNFALCGGIAGSAAAETELQITNSPDIGGHYLGLINYDYADVPWAITAGQFYTDLQGTGTADSSGSEMESLGIAGYMPNAGSVVARASLFNSRTIHFMLRAMRTSGAVTQKMYPMVRLNSGRDTLGEGITISLANSRKLYYLGNMRIVFPTFLRKDQQRLMYSIYQGAGGNTWEGDYLCAIPGKIAYYSHNTLDTDTNTVSYLKGIEGIAIYNSGLNQLTRRGDVIELEPEKINHLLHFIGDESGSGAVGDTATFVVYEKPRWSLL